MPLPKTAAHAMAIPFRDSYCMGAFCNIKTRLVFVRGDEWLTQTEFNNVLDVIKRLAL